MSDLHPDLEPYIEQTPIFGRVLRHPLVYMIPYDPVFNDDLNKQYQQKMERIDQADKDGSYATAIWLFERPWRLQAFMTRCHVMPDDIYWKLLGELWTDTEYPHARHRDWRRLFLQNRPGRELLMNDEEREVLAAMPINMPVFRGVSNNHSTGLAWTTTVHKAKWFAQRFDGSDPTIISMMVPREEIVAYLDHRDEHECIIPRADKYKPLWRRTPCPKNESPSPSTDCIMTT